MLAPDPMQPRSSPVPPTSLQPVGCADRSDGTYQNPVLCADYSDPDAIRVGDDFWLTASSFSHVPGLPILHSRDLVNWSLVNHALPRLVPDEHFSRPRHGEGVWAPTIRHHAGKFWIFYPDPDFGIYVLTADDPRGTWSPPRLVKGGRGLIDPCPFWDEDGTAYLIHGWAKSRSGISNRLTLHRLAADGASVTDQGTIIIDGAQMPGWHTIEGPKLYRRGIYYYIFAPAGGVRDGYQAVFRSRNIFGPYESRVVLEQGATPVNGPHQGAWVDTPAGEHWFLHFQELPAYGRVVHLQPMHWGDDAWPRMGAAGNPVITHRKPALPPQPLSAPATSDRFATTALGHQWQWQCNPRPGWHSRANHGSGLRLNCVPLAPGQTLWSAGHLLLQKFPAPLFTATTTANFAPLADGDTAGLVIFGYDYAWLGVRREKNETRLVLATCTDAHTGSSEKEHINIIAPTSGLKLTVAVGPNAECRFAYAILGGPPISIGPVFHARSSKWVGAKVGLFATSLASIAAGGHADFHEFTLTA